MAMEVRRCVTRQLPNKSFLEDEVITHVAAPPVSCKKPQCMVFVQEVAKTAVGKLNRHLMR